MSDNIMGTNEGTVEATLKQRGKVYGDYKDVVATRSYIMKVLSDHYSKVNDQPMPADIQLMFSDVVLKLVRAASSPQYEDSWLDLCGYSKLIQEVLSENN